MSDALLVELPVVTGAVLGGLGWATKKILDRLNGLGTWMIQSRAEHGEYTVDLTALNRAVPQIKEDLAILTREVERHLEWHESHRPHEHPPWGPRT